MENNKQLSTPMAVVLAGLLVMLGILLTKNSNNQPITNTPKTLSEQVGVSKDALSACVGGTDIDALSKSINASVNDAMSGLSNNERGTPYSVVIGKNNVMTDIRGALPYDNVKKLIDEAMAGKVTSPYKGKIALSEPTDHIMGNANAPVTVIEYSDFECPYCKRFHPVMEQIMADYNGNVRWIYRSFPLHQHSFEKLVAANCVGQIKGNDAFWKYANLLFGILKTADDSVSDQL